MNANVAKRRSVISRRWLWAKWFAVALSIITLLLWTLSLGWCLYYKSYNRIWWVSDGGLLYRGYYGSIDTRRFHIEPQRGELGYTLEWNPSLHASNPPRSIRDATWSMGFWMPHWYFKLSMGPLGAPLAIRQIALPFWVPFLGFSVAAIGCYWKERRHRTAPGRCRRCGYDLRGNISGRCPECGTQCQADTGDRESAT